MPLTYEQTAHLSRLVTEFEHKLEAKYTKGAEEHGGDLRDLTPLQLIDNALDEVIDQWVYLSTLREKLS